MEKIYNLFKKNLPIIFILSLVGLVFGILTFVYYYNPSTVSINFKNVIPIFAVIFIALAIGVSIYFTVKVDKLHLSRIKKNSGFSKFAALLAATLAAALFFFNFFKFVLEPSSFSIIMILRLIVFVPFIAYLIIGIIPKKIKKVRIELPKWLKPVTSTCTLLWSILSLMTIYFWNSGGLTTANLFKNVYIFYYILATVFFLFEIKFELFAPSHRAYIISALLLFVYTFSVTGSIMVAKFLGQLSVVTVSDFEIFLSFSIGIYALSKLIAMQQTLKFVMKKGGSSHRHHHHHHHHHKNSDDNKAVIDTENVVNQQEVTEQNN